MKISSFLIFSADATRIRRSVNFYDNAMNLNAFYDPAVSSLDGTYGCFCNYFTGDRQFSQPGFPGPRPVDASDAVCKAHKDCLACVRDEFGDECIPESEDNVFGHEGGQCTDERNTCKRALCECQKQAAIDQSHVKYTRSDTFYWMWNGGIEFFKTRVCPNLCPAKDLVLTTSIPQAEEDTLFSLHDEFFNNNVCLKSTQGLTLRLSGDKYELVTEDDDVLYEAKTEGCPDKVTTWISTEDGSEVNLELAKLPSNNPPAPVGEKQCCKNNDGGYKVFNNGNHQCCDDGSVKPFGLC